MIIIKSMSRKTSSFSQLLNYINKGRTEEDEYHFRHNIYATKPYFITKEYLENHKKIKKRKNTNSLFHEVISIKYQNGYTKEELREILKDITEQYIKSRANNCLVYAVIHEQHNQIHSHLMISSNELENSKTHYFSQAKFEEIKNALREYAYAKYQNLEQLENKKDKAKKNTKSKTQDKEIHLKKRTGKTLDKETAREKLKNIFARSQNPNSFTQNLTREGFEVYKRGNTFGFIEKTTGKKYRIKTLGLEDEFQKMNDFFIMNEKEHSSKEKDETRDKKKQAKDNVEENTKENTSKDREKEAFQQRIDEARKENEQYKKKTKIKTFTKNK